MKNTLIWVSRRGLLMKPLTLIFILVVAVSDVSARECFIQDGIRACEVYPTPPEPPSRCTDCYSPHQQRPTVEQPRPLSWAERKQLEARQRLMEAQKQQIKAELSRLTRGFQIQRAQPTIELTPRGNDYFNRSPDSGERPFGQIMVASLSGIGTPASRIPLENLRRAAAILERFKPGNIGNMSEEDMSFLASQSALAMEGAPLSVVIVDAPAGKEEQARQLVKQAQDIEVVREAAQQATAERLRVGERLVKVQQELQTGKGDPKALNSEREKLLVSYKEAWTVETDNKGKLGDLEKKIVYVVISGGKS